jgi:putative photosynthetic complex assembly protein 2
MTEHVYPALFALFVWWFSTGVIIYLDGLPQRTFRWSMLGATVVFGASLYGLGVTADDATVKGAYLAFTFGLLAWGWQEISFYMGYVTGPRNHPCEEGCAGWRHFGHAVATSLWHELAIIASAAVVFWLTWGSVNQIGCWTFMVLWWMHQSAKLNVFLGVRNLNEEFLPEHLDFLKSYLTKKPMNLLFPVSVTVSTVITVMLAEKALAADATAFEAAGYTFLAVMMTLAILEHWFLVLPLPAAALWHWGLASRTPAKSFDAEIVAGFLGAGKTTFLQRTLASADPAVKTVVLVNDFASVGVDNSLLGDQGADVVELPNGCICCSLRADLAKQLQDVVGRFAPDRVLIEPSGVADVAALLRVMHRAELKPFVRSLRVYTVIDAGAFLRDFARMQPYFKAQAALAPVLVVNKTDLVGEAEYGTIEETLRSINPAATILAARYGLTEADGLAALALTDLVGKADDEEGEAHDHHHHGDDLEAALGFRSWSAAIDGPCDADGLRALLDRVARGAFGEVDRVKGIARAGAGWIQFGVAGGRATMAAFAARDDERPRVVAIGKRLDEPGLKAAFEACASPVEGPAQEITTRPAMAPA